MFKQLVTGLFITVLIYSGELLIKVDVKEKDIKQVVKEEK